MYFAHVVTILNNAIDTNNICHIVSQKHLQAGDKEKRASTTLAIITSYQNLITPSSLKQSMTSLLYTRGQKKSNS
jgi:hypothetical protein